MFTSSELAGMRSTQEAHMMHVCELLTHTVIGADEYGMPIRDYVLYTTTICGLDTRASREMINAEAHVYDARLRLPYATKITNVDRVRITHRYGELLDNPIIYDVIGSPISGPSGQIVNLRSVV